MQLQAASKGGASGAFKLHGAVKAHVVRPKGQLQFVQADRLRVGVPPCCAARELEGNACPVLGDGSAKVGHKVEALFAGDDIGRQVERKFQIGQPVREVQYAATRHARAFAQGIDKAGFAVHIQAVQAHGLAVGGHKCGGGP